MEEKLFQELAQELSVSPKQVSAAVLLLDEGNTVPFIARYRKEMTGELTDEELRVLAERLAYLRNREARREEIIRLITEQEKMTEELLTALEKATKIQELEDLYLPYKPKRRTRASVAREYGLEALALYLRSEEAAIPPVVEAEKFLSESVTTVEEALAGARDIIAEDMSDDAGIRQSVREALVRDAFLVGDLVQEDEELRTKYLAYENFKEAVKQIPSHRVLAVNRAEKEKALKVTIEAPHDTYISRIVARLSPKKGTGKDEVALAIEDGYKRLLFPALERELRSALTERAEEQAIHVFATNLKSLLLQTPLANHVIMGLDPGYRTGCKMAIIDKQGTVLETGTYYLTHSDAQREKAQKTLAMLIRKYGITLLSIGNGTASYETEQFASKMIQEEKLDCHYIITNEAGASVYSASKLATEELPELDVSLRGAVSIARRVQDPLAESVKIDPKSIGVGQYQHDVNQKELAESLDQVVEQVVNYVGVDLNTASSAILSHIAGVSKTVANNIVAYKVKEGAFTNRKQLLKVPRLGPSAFTQCAGFLKIASGDNPLDNTPVHPESYGIAEMILQELGVSLETLLDKKELSVLQAKLPLVKVEDMARTVGAGVPTVRDILEALAKPGRDPREDLPLPMTRKQIASLDDMKVGAVVKGKVNNVVDFGAFVDIGIKVNGLMHRNTFCKRNQHPSDIVAVGDVMDFEIVSVEERRGRIGLKPYRTQGK